MIIEFNNPYTSMVSIPDSMPWRIVTDSDDEYKSSNEDYGLVLTLEYGKDVHILSNSDEVRAGALYKYVSLDDVEECYDIIISKVCDWASNPECRFLPLIHIVNDTVNEFQEEWRKKYRLSAS